MLKQDVNGSLVPVDDTKKIQDHATKSLNDLYLDTDKDGIPDTDDAMDNTSSATDFMGALNQINEAIDDIAGEIDQLIE